MMFLGSAAPVASPAVMKMDRAILAPDVQGSRATARQRVVPMIQNAPMANRHTQAPD